jgi:hypothetical protein
MESLQEDYEKKSGGGSKDPKKFNPVTPQRRAELRDKILKIRGLYQNNFRAYPDVPCVARVRLHEDALAKSHRPLQVFKTSTCPIIGSGDFGELFIQVSEQGLGKLAQDIMTTQAKKAVANISAIDDISPYSGNDVIIQKDLVTNNISDNRPVKIQLFKMSMNHLDNQVSRNFIKHLASCGAHLEQEIQYSRNVIIYQVICENETQLEEISTFGAIRKIAIFPRYKLSRLSLHRMPGSSSSFPTPQPGQEYPIVGLIDSGIPQGHVHLEPWIENRENFVPAAYQNQGHASFIGGIMAFGDALSPYNHHQTGVRGVKILDIGVVPNDDPRYGPVDDISEDRLINILRDVIPRHKDKVKFWNLSLGSSVVCNLNAFSDLAVAIDSIQTENGVTLAIASGNYLDNPQREWPPQTGIGDQDLICPPADSLRSLVVGAISQVDNPRTVVKKHEPSSFSRRGFGPNFIVKPDLVHFGGNCDHTLDPVNAGLISIDEKGHLVEANGTSFSTPYVTALLASVYQAFGGRLSLNLAKALVLHSCFHPHTGKLPDRDAMKYYGYGLPKDLNAILMATRSTGTLIYENRVVDGSLIKIKDFPFPSCMIRDGKCYGDIWMTLVYDPPLNNNYGLEYCRVNLDAGLGRFSHEVDEETGEVKERFNSEVPYQPLRKKGELEQLYERKLVEFGFKWSPVKRYYKHLRGMEYKPWGLEVTMNARAEEQTVSPQSFALLISFHDPKGGDVHGELMKIIDRPRVELEVEERVRTILGL